jgi:hypothetical protein
LRSTQAARLAAAGEEFVAMIVGLGGQTEEIEVADR